MAIEVYHANTYHLKSPCLPPTIHAWESIKTGLSLQMFPALVRCDSLICRNTKLCKGIISTVERGDAWEIMGAVLTEIQFENFSRVQIIKGLTCTTRCFSKAQKWGVF